MPFRPQPCLRHFLLHAMCHVAPFVYTSSCSDGDRFPGRAAELLNERKRWRNWNEGGRGGYTEQFFDRYKNVRMEEPNKNKYDKRMKGSVGPGSGMEYMARWTGSKNSFN
eukprot:s444_g18.t1